MHAYVNLLWTAIILQKIRGTCVHIKIIIHIIISFYILLSLLHIIVYSWFMTTFCCLISPPCEFAPPVFPYTYCTCVIVLHSTAIDCYNVLDQACCRREREELWQYDIYLYGKGPLRKEKQAKVLCGVSDKLTLERQWGGLKQEWKNARLFIRSGHCRSQHWPGKIMHT